jgi:alpha-L-fucosidase
MEVFMNAEKIQWFRDAHFGLFIHYGLYSLMGRGEWVQFNEKIPVGEYEKLKEQFTAKHLDADFITDLALEAGMKYVNLTTMHHDGFCLFDTQQTDFHSLNSPSRRDIVAEFAQHCHRKGLGFCLYYSHGRHWRHPHTLTCEKYDWTARPAYDSPEPRYAAGDAHDIRKYVAYCKAQVTELLTQYGHVDAIWFDGWGTPMAGPWQQELEIPDLYQTIRQLQPNCLIAYKLGLTGTEDFYAPEYHWADRYPQEIAQAQATGKPIELCTHIAGWGYVKANVGKHRGAQSVIDNLEHARSQQANLLLNIGPEPDGQVNPQDIATLRHVGRQLKAGIDV